MITLIRVGLVSLIIVTLYLYLRKDFKPKDVNLFIKFILIFIPLLTLIYIPEVYFLDSYNEEIIRVLVGFNKILQPWLLIVGLILLLIFTVTFAYKTVQNKSR